MFIEVYCDKVFLTLYSHTHTQNAHRYSTLISDGSCDTEDWSNGC